MHVLATVDAISGGPLRARLVKPMTEFAQDFGLSDVALAKRCRNSACRRGAATGRASRRVRPHDNQRFGNGPTT